MQADYLAQKQGAQQVEAKLVQGDSVQVISDTANEKNTIISKINVLNDLTGVVIGSFSHKVSHPANFQ